MDIIEVKNLGIHSTNDWDEKNEKFEIVNFKFRGGKLVTRYSSVVDFDGLSHFSEYYVYSFNNISDTNISEIKFLIKDYKNRLVSIKDIKSILTLDFLIRKNLNTQKKYHLKNDELIKLIDNGLFDDDFNDHINMTNETPGYIIFDNFRGLFEKSYYYKDKKRDEYLPF